MPLVNPDDFIHIDENAVVMTINGTDYEGIFSVESYAREDITRMTKASAFVPADGLSNPEGGTLIQNGVNYEVIEAHLVGQNQFWRMRLKRGA